MFTPHIFDETPLTGDSPAEMEAVYLDIPSLEISLYSREYGATIYGAETYPAWTVSTDAFRGKEAFDHWIKSMMSLFLLRLVSMLLLKWTTTKQIKEYGWTGKAIISYGKEDSEIHFIVYSEELDISVNLHLQLPEKSNSAYEKGLGYLKEICLHEEP